MAEGTSLDGILDESTPENVVETTTETPVTTEKVEVERPQSTRQKHQAREFEAQGRDPATGKFVPKEVAETEKAAEPAKTETVSEPAKTEAPKQEAQQFTPKELAFLRAAQEEREKRQRLEAQIAAMQQAQAPKEPEKAFWDDPEAALRKQQEQIQSQIVGTRLQTAELIAKQRYPDFDEMAQYFVNMAQHAPHLAQQAINSLDPAEFAYRTGKMQKMLNEAGGVDKLVEKARFEERAKVEAEMKAQIAAKQAEIDKQRSALPSSLSDIRGGTQNRVTWGGPSSLDDILKSH